MVLGVVAVPGGAAAFGGDPALGSDTGVAVAASPGDATGVSGLETGVASEAFAAATTPVGDLVSTSSTAPSSPVRVGDLTLDSGENVLGSVVSDGEFAYFGTDTLPGRVVKVELATMTRVGAVTLDSGDNSLLSAVSDGEFGYFGTLTSPGRVVKVELATMTRVGAVTLDSGENFLVSAVSDGTFAYFGTSTSPGRVVKVELATMTRVGAVTLDSGENVLGSVVSDGEFGYFGTNTNPGRVVKVELATMTRVGAVTLDSGDNRLLSAVSDGEFGYFGTFTSPGRVVKVRLADMTRVGAVTLDFGENFLVSVVSDGEFAYFGTLTLPGRVVKVELATMTRVGAVTLDSGENQLRSAVSDGTFGYFGTNTNPGRVVKVELDPDLPGLPTDVSVEVFEGGVTVGFGAPEDTGGLPLVGFDVTVTRVGDGGGSTPVVCEVGPSVSSCEVTLLDETGVYSVGVQAESAAGLSPVAEFAGLVTPGAGSPVPEFVDVPDGSFFVRPTSMLKLRGITEGTNPAGDEFSPQRFVNRQQMAAFLWRLAGEPDAPASCGFVDETQIPGFARQAACWLKQTGITTNNPYNPGGLVNRQQMAAFLWRFAGEPPAAVSCGFADGDDIRLFAREAACWLKQTDITTNNPYDPAGIVNRAQMSAFLYRLGAEQDFWVRVDN